MKKHITTAAQLDSERAPILAGMQVTLIEISAVTAQLHDKIAKINAARAEAKPKPRRSSAFIFWAITAASLAAWIPVIILIRYLIRL